MFDKLLEATKEARKQKGDLVEYTDALAKMLGAKIKNILEQHQKDIHALDKELRDRLYKIVGEGVKEAIVEIENYPKRSEL